MACMTSASSPSASSTTASGLPAKRRSVNTSSVAKRRRIGASSGLEYVRLCLMHTSAAHARPSPREAGRGSHTRQSKPFDQAGVDEQPIEATRLGAAGAGVEQPLAALQNSFLLGEGGIERQAGCLLHNERKIGALNRVERGGEIDGFEIDD